MKIKLKEPTPDMAAFRDDLIAVLNKHAGALDAAEMMALAAYTTGQIMAMLDARKWTPELVMEIVTKNLLLPRTLKLEMRKQLQKLTGGCRAHKHRSLT